MPDVFVFVFGGGGGGASFNAFLSSSSYVLIFRGGLGIYFLESVYCWLYFVEVYRLNRSDGWNGTRKEASKQLHASKEAIMQASMKEGATCKNCQNKKKAKKKQTIDGIRLDSR